MEGPVVSRVRDWELSLGAVDSAMVRAFANYANV